MQALAVAVARERAQLMMEEQQPPAPCYVTSVDWPTGEHGQLGLHQRDQLQQLSIALRAEERIAS